MENLKFHESFPNYPQGWWRIRWRNYPNNTQLSLRQILFSFGNRVKAKGHRLPFFQFDQQSFQTLVQFWAHYFQHIVIKDSVEAWPLMAFRCCLPHPT